MKRRLPIMLTLEQRLVVVVGGGAVAARRVPQLFDAGATVTVIAVKLHPTLRKLYEKGQLQWEQRQVQPNEHFHADVLMLMTDDRELNESLYRQRRQHQFVYRADAAEKK